MRKAKVKKAWLPLEGYRERPDNLWTEIMAVEYYKEVNPNDPENGDNWFEEDRTGHRTAKTDRWEEEAGDRIQDPFGA